MISVKNVLEKEFGDRLKVTKYEAHTGEEVIEGKLDNIRFIYSNLDDKVVSLSSGYERDHNGSPNTSYGYLYEKFDELKDVISSCVLLEPSLRFIMGRALSDYDTKLSTNILWYADRKFALDRSNELLNSEGIEYPFYLLNQELLFDVDPLEIETSVARKAKKPGFMQSVRSFFGKKSS